MREVYRYSNTVIKTAISKTKKQLYRNKKKEIIKEVGKGVVNEIIEGGFSIGVEYFDYKYSFKNII